MIHLNRYMLSLAEDGRWTCPLGRKSETGINRICHLQSAASCCAADCSVYVRQIATSASIDCPSRFGSVRARWVARIESLTRCDHAARPVRKSQACSMSTTKQIGTVRVLYPVGMVPPPAIRRLVKEMQHARITFVTEWSAADKYPLRAAQSCLASGEHLSFSNSGRLNSGDFLDGSLN